MDGAGRRVRWVHVVGSWSWSAEAGSRHKNLVAYHPYLLFSGSCASRAAARFPLFWPAKAVGYPRRRLPQALARLKLPRFPRKRRRERGGERWSHRRQFPLSSLAKFQGGIENRTFANSSCARKKEKNTEEERITLRDTCNDHVPPKKLSGSAPGDTHYGELLQNSDSQGIDSIDSIVTI